MAIKHKRLGAYNDVVNIYYKKQGVYSAVLGVYEKLNGVYQSLTNQNPIRVVATNQRYPGAAFGGSSTTNRAGRVAIEIGSGTVTELIPTWSTMSNGNSGDTPPGTDYSFTVSEMYLEDGNTGQLYPVKLNGQTSFTVPMMNPKFMLDAMPCASIGYPNGIPRGTKNLWWRWGCTQASTQTMRANYFTDVIAGQCGWHWLPASGSVSPINALGPITKTGTVFGGVGLGNSVEVPGPITMGRFKESDAISFVAMGDSLYYGSNATITDTKYRGYGVPSRSAYEPDGLSNPIAGIIIARSGNDVGDMSGSNKATWTYFENVTHGSVCLGTNNVGVGGGSTDPTVYNNLLAALRSIWNGMKAAGMLKVSTLMLLPNTTSTDDYTTLVNQTATSQWGAGGFVDNFRTNLLNEVGTNGLDACLEFNMVRWSGARWAWVGKPANSYHWGDGTNSPPLELDLQGMAAPELRAFWLS